MSEAYGRNKAILITKSLAGMTLFISLFVTEKNKGKLVYLWPPSDILLQKGRPINPKL